MASTREEAELLHQTERWYAEFCARRDQLQAEFAQEWCNAHNATNEAIRLAEAEFQRNMQLVAGDGTTNTTSIKMVEELMTTEKVLKIEMLRNQPAKMLQHFQKLLLIHYEKFREEYLAQIRSKPAPYGPGPQQRLLSASRPPPPPVRQSDISMSTRAPLGTSVDHPLAHDYIRLGYPHQQQHEAFRRSEYPPRGVTLRLQPSPAPYTEQALSRCFGQLPGLSRSSSESTSGGPDRQLQYRQRIQSPSFHTPNSHAVEGRPCAPVVPIQQTILPSSRRTVEPQREHLAEIRSKPVAYGSGPQQRSLSDSQPPLSPVRQSDIPIYARAPLGSNVDRPPTYDHHRQDHPQAQHQAAFRQGDYPPRGVHEQALSRYVGQPPGLSRPSSEYSTSVGSDQHLQHGQRLQSPSFHTPHGHAIEDRPRAPVVSIQQIILPSSPTAVEPQQEHLAKLRSKPAPYGPGPQQRLLSASRPPPSPVRQSDSSLYTRAPSATSVDHPPAHDYNRPGYPHQQQHEAFRRSEYPPRGVTLRLQPSPAPYTEHALSRCFGQLPGLSRSSSESTSGGPDRQLQHRQRIQSPSFHTPNGHAVEGRPCAPVVPIQQTILPSSLRTVEPQRFSDPLIEPFDAAGGLTASPPQTLGNARGLRANAHSKKRKSDAGDDSQTQLPSAKRSRSVGAQAFGGKAGGDSGLDAQSVIPHPVVQRTIEFDEVYQDGKAKYKHVIIQYPQGRSDGDWYILKCDEHGVHFKPDPLRGALRHLRLSHSMSMQQDLAIRELGHLVRGCTKELADKNNDTAMRAFENGYKAFNRNQLSKRELKSMGFVEQDTNSARTSVGGTRHSQRKKEKSEQGPIGTKDKAAGIPYPIDGELYLCWWKRNKTNYPVVILPWGNMEPYKLRGTLKGTGLLEKHTKPKCYNYDSVTLEIIGWAEGYEDGGPLVHKREFPVMYFDKAERNSVGWVNAKDLSRFNFDDPNWRDIPFYTKARDHYAAAQPEAFSDYPSMKNSYEARGTPLKRLSDVRDSLKTATADAAVQGMYHAADREVDGRTFPAREGSAEADGHGGPLDVEMRDVARADDMTSGPDRESVLLKAPDSDEDVEMGTAENRRTSVSNEVPKGDKPEAFDTQAADSPIANGNEGSALIRTEEAADESLAANAGGKELATDARTGHISPPETGDGLDRVAATTNGSSATEDPIAHEEDMTIVCAGFGCS